jgi:hypothetical protein
MQADLVPVATLREWLKAAEDQAAQDWTVNFDLAHYGSARYLSGGTGADETDLYSLNR